MCTVLQNLQCKQKSDLEHPSADPASGRVQSRAWHMTSAHIESYGSKCKFEVAWLVLHQSPSVRLQASATACSGNVEQDESGMRKLVSRRMHVSDFTLQMLLAG